MDKFQITLTEILGFVFPSILQHPMAVGRLVVYGLYGPLVNGRIKAGSRGKHDLMSWEIDEMCIQIEREDMLQVYLHKGQSFESLSRSEQDALINQADQHLKCAKGQAMLPQVTKEEINDLFSVDDFDSCDFFIADLVVLMPQHLQDEDGYLSFHEVQKVIEKFRIDRINQFKLAYPLLTRSHRSRRQITQEISSKKKYAVASPTIAPPSMFQKNVGLTNADIIDQVFRTFS